MADNSPMTIDFIFLYNGCIKNICKVVYVCYLFGVFFGLYNPVPPPPPPQDQRRPLHMLCMYVAAFHCPNDILGLGGWKHLKQTERRKFQLSNDKSHVLSIFYTHAQEKFFKLL